MTHDINQDPEVWELTDTFGDRALRVWLECLSIAGRNEGLVGPNSEQLHAVLASKCRVYSPKVRAILVWLFGKGWLVDRDGLRVTNWLKYNTSRKSKNSPTRLDETRQDNKRLDKNKKAQAPLVVIPDWLDSTVWESYRQHRAAMPQKNHLTANAETLAIAQLDKWRGAGHDPNEIVKTSVMNGWMGLFKPKENVTPIRQTEGELSERTKRILRRGL